MRRKPVTVRAPGADYEIRIVGDRRTPLRDFYHALLRLPWWATITAISGAFLAANALFALAYLLVGGVEHAAHGSFRDAFFFSVQTMATIGFGVMHPVGLYSNVIVTAEALMGLAGFALATGLIFQRFSRPTARVLFSRVAVVTPYDGITTLMFRCANERSNQILEAEVHVYLAREEISAEGLTLRRSHDLALSRSRNPLFSFTWTVLHPIDAKSPLRGATAASLAAQDAAVVVTLTGIDESLSQPIFARYSYGPSEILWGRRFVDILSRMDDGQRVVDYRRFHDTETGTGSG